MSEKILKFRARAKWLPFSLVVLVGFAALIPYIFVVNFDPVVKIIIFGLITLLILFFLVIPFFKWLARTTTFTSEKIIVKHGIFVRHKREVWLSEISEMNLRRGPGQRMLKSGDIILRTNSGGSLVLRNVPGLTAIAGALQELLA